MTKTRGASRPVVLMAALLAMVSVFVYGAQPASAAGSYRPLHWDDGHVRINVSIELNAYFNPGNGEPALIRSDAKYNGEATPAQTHKYCSAHSASAGFYRTQQCITDAGNELKNNLTELDRYLGPLTHCEAPVGRRLLQDRHSLTLAFATAAAYYGYSVSAGYAGHYLPHLAGPHLTIQVQAGLLALAIIAVHFINILHSRSPTLPEMLATVASWFANSAVLEAISALRSNFGETLTAYFDQHPTQEATCTALANMV